MKTRTLAAVSIAAVIALAGCAAPAPEPAPGEGEPASIRILGIGGLDFSAVDMLKWQENLEADDFTVDFKFVEDIDAAIRATLAGAADVIIGSVPSVIKAVDNTDAPIKLVAVNAQATSYVVLAKNEVRTLDDLTGRTIGVNTPGTIGDTIMRLALEAEGFDTDSPEYAVIGGTGARIAALQAGQVDATVAHLANAEAAIRTGQFHALLYCGPALGPYIQTGLIASDAFLANRDVAQRTVDALIDAQRWAASEKDEYIALSYEAEAETEDDVRDSSYDQFVEIDFFGVDGGMSEERIDNWLEVSIDAGDLSADLPDKSTWLDDSFVRDYLDRNGPFAG